MKRFILSIILCILCACACPVAPKQAKAELSTPYACILTDKAYFYNDIQSGKGLFLLPETYYVRILEYGDEFCRVEYLYDDTYTKKLVGYVKTEHLTPVEYTPKKAYFYRLIEVRYTIEQSPENGEGFLDEIRMTCAYYGDYVVGTKTYCYVLRGEQFGYVPKPDNFIFEPNSEYEEWLASQTPPTAAPSPESAQNSPTQIAILVALCLLVPVLAALILRPQRTPPYEE